jgi:hypothetical protein
VLRGIALLRRVLARVVARRDWQARIGLRRGFRRTGLLRHVGELVREDLAALGVRIDAHAEEHASPNRERARIERSRRCLGLRTRHDARVADIGTDLRGPRIGLLQRRS